MPAILLRLRKAFYSDKIGYYYGFGYALPLLVVSVTALLQYKSYGDPDRGHCWLKTDEYMVWSFAGPVLVVIVINAIFLVSALRIVQIHRYVLPYVTICKTLRNYHVTVSSGGEKVKIYPAYVIGQGG